MHQTTDASVIHSQRDRERERREREIERQRERETEIQSKRSRKNHPRLHLEISPKVTLEA